MFFTYLFTALTGLAFLLEFAVDRAPDLHDSHDNKAARRVLIAGLFVLFCWTLYRSFSGYAGNPLPMFGLTLIMLAEIAFCMNRLFPDISTAIERTMLKARHRETLQ